VIHSLCPQPQRGERSSRQFLSPLRGSDDVPFNPSHGLRRGLVRLRAHTIGEVEVLSK
jgi:hypothetical protein